MRTSRHRLSAVVIAVCLWGISGAGAQAQEGSPREYQIKAAFLYNFIPFVRWPGGGSTLTIGVLGHDPFGSTLDALGGRTIKGRTLVVRRVTSLQEALRCQIVFVSSSERERLRQILETLRSAQVLTVGETGGFARSGGIINFTTERNKVRFEINPDAAEQAGLKISSQVLKLAKIVRT